MNHPSAQRLIISNVFMILTFYLKYRSKERVCGVGDARHLKCTYESIVQQTDPEGGERKAITVCIRKKYVKVQCAVTTLNKYPPSFREARTFPQRLRHSSCAWSRLTASRLSLLAPERLWGRGRERGKKASPERAVLRLSSG